MESIALTAEQQASANWGVILHGEMVEAGWPDGVVGRYLQDLPRLTRGAYALELPDDPVRRHLLEARAHLLTRPSEHCLSHTTAALWWQLPLLGPVPERVCLTTMTGTSGRRRNGVRVQGQPVARSDVVERDGWLVTSPTRTVLDCGRTLPTAAAVVIADAALRAGLTSKRRLLAGLKQMKGWTGVGMARAMVARSDPAAESPGESVCRLTLRAIGFDLESQVPIRHGAFSARADFRIRGTWVLVEFDGRTKIEGKPEQGRHALWSEKRRHDKLTSLGYEVVHVTWEDLDDRDTLRETIARAMTLSARRHGPSRAQP